MPIETRASSSARIIRALWRGDVVTERGHVTVQEAQLYVRPATPPLMLGAALSEGTARFVGGWADGLITVGTEADALRQIIDAFRAGGGTGKPIYLQLAISWAETDDQAKAVAHEQWRSSALGRELLAMLRTPAQFEAAASHVRPDDVSKGVLISADFSRVADRIQQYAELGVDRVYIHNVNRNQAEFVKAFAAEVLPPFGAVGA